MSFVYAQKIGKSIGIFADTKITFNTAATHLFGTDTQKSVHQFGMIKNIIISKNFCISFAGNNIVYANKLLSKINHVSLKQILQLALDINRQDIDNGAEFIICYADRNVQLIFQIKDGSVRKHLLRGLVPTKHSITFKGCAQVFIDRILILICRIAMKPTLVPVRLFQKMKCIRTC